MPAYQENNGSGSCSHSNNEQGEGTSSLASKERNQRRAEKSSDGFRLSGFRSVTPETSYFMNERRWERNQSFVECSSDTFLLTSRPHTPNTTPETYYHVNERREDKEQKSSPAKRKKFTKFEESYAFGNPTSSNDIESWFWKI